MSRARPSTCEFADALGHPPQRFDVAKLRRPAQPVLAGDPLPIESHRLGDERRRGAELGEGGPVARHLERGGEARVPRVGDVGRADEPRVVGEEHREPGLGDDGLSGRGEVQAEAAVERGVDRQQCDVTRGVDLVDHHHPALAHRLYERRVDQCHLPASTGDRDVVVAEEELIGRRDGLKLDEPVERGSVPLGDLAAAARPQPVRDRAGDLALARAGRADQPQKARLRRVLHVEQRQDELVDRCAVQARRVDPLAVGQQDRLAWGGKLERCGSFGHEVSLGGHPVDLRQGSGDCAHARLLSNLVTWASGPYTRAARACQLAGCARA